MDPVSAIIGALIAGATAAMKETASQAVKDAYAGLKRILIDTYSIHSIGLVEKKPNNAAFRQAAESELKDSAALADRQVMEHALAVLTAALRDLANVSAGGYGIDAETIKAGQNLLIERVSGGHIGIRAGTIEAGGDMTLRDIQGTGPKK
jgi:hypothetical protein